VKAAILPRAEDDIIGPFRYYALEQDAPRTATRLREGVRVSLNQLKAHPRMGAMIRCSIPDLRCWPVRGFSAIRIYYLESPGSIRVVRIRHGKRDVRRVLADEYVS
jgi:plasmid stabilization system protein ParE